MVEYLVAEWYFNVSYFTFLLLQRLTATPCGDLEQAAFTGQKTFL